MHYRAAHHELPHNDAERVDIGELVDAAAAENLRRGVRAEDRAAALPGCVVRAGEEPCDARRRVAAGERARDAPVVVHVPLQATPRVGAPSPGLNAYNDAHACATFNAVGERGERQAGTFGDPATRTTGCHSTAQAYSAPRPPAMRAADGFHAARVRGLTVQSTLCRGLTGFACGGAGGAGAHVEEDTGRAEAAVTDAMGMQEMHAVGDVAEQRGRDGPLLPHHRAAEQALAQRLLQAAAIAVRLREGDLKGATAAVARVVERAARVAVRAQHVRVYKARHERGGRLRQRLLHDGGLGVKLEDVPRADRRACARLGACTSRTRPLSSVALSRT